MTDLTDSVSTTAYDYRLEILDDGIWRLWLHDWNQTTQTAADQYARQIAEKHTPHLNVAWRVILWGAGIPKHLNNAAAVLEGQPIPVDQRPRVDLHADCRRDEAAIRADERAKVADEITDEARRIKAEDGVIVSQFARGVEYAATVARGTTTKEDR